jgi:hypothetical protein
MPDPVVCIERCYRRQSLAQRDIEGFMGRGLRRLASLCSGPQLCGLLRCPAPRCQLAPAWARAHVSRSRALRRIRVLFPGHHGLEALPP